VATMVFATVDMVCGEGYGDEGDVCSMVQQLQEIRAWTAFNQNLGAGLL
jgi:hypothetical protein